MSGRRVLVTGGGGFLGRRIVEMLVERGDAVRSFSRGEYPELRALGVDVRRGELESARDVRRACEGYEVVYHAAALPGIWGDYQEYHRPNVVGTRNVLEACRAAGARALVYTSSPSVVFDGRDMEGVDESAPYPDRYEAHYPRTKAIAEREVLEANGPMLATVSLRPHLIWGPRDNHLVPRIFARAHTLRRIGGLNKLVDSTYIDNAAEAHVLAGDSLRPGAPHAGRAYFISNGEPRPIWDLVSGILAAGGLPPVTRSVPYSVALTAAATMEAGWRLLRIRREPKLTRFLVHELTTAHWFNISAARRAFGYVPRVTIEEGLARLKEWLKKS
ncbi:MAG: 3-beta hydroxysteroid dehydrogenase [Planctomycetota bacterium]|nr:MAG: 3-beta hydroxysteroid dehydrogenase [Planctomycetota bacterium]